jgi:hypothetical protein
VKREEEVSREDLLAIWERGEPVSRLLPYGFYERRHSTCATNASGHQGPCTCRTTFVHRSLSPRDRLHGGFTLVPDA